MSQDFSRLLIKCLTELSAERKLLQGVKDVRVNESKFLFLFNCPRSLKRCRMEETFIEVVSTVKVICGVKSLVVLDVTVRVTRLSALAITFVFL